MAAPPRSPHEVEAEIAKESQFYGTINAALDFLYSASEDALGKQVRREVLTKGIA